MSEEKFRWPAPPPGTLTPLNEDFLGSPAEQVEIVEWFCRRRGKNTVIPTTRALGRWIERMSRARYTQGDPSEAPGLLSGEPADDLAMYVKIVDTIEFDHLTWAIRVVETRSEPVVIDPTYITRELIGSDLADNDQRGGPVMPSGVATICLAARLLQASGGRMRINGAHSQGRDIEWEPASGGLLWIERKDRAFRAAYDDPPDRFIKEAESKIKLAARRMPKQKTAARLIVFGGFRRSFAEAQQLRDQFCIEERNRDWSSVPSDLLPDVVAIEVRAVHVDRATCTPATFMGLAETNASLGKEQYGRVKAALGKAFDVKPPSRIADLGPPQAITYSASRKNTEGTDPSS
ncbi:MAG: hypothetical protein M0R80_19325 [Proteobacteria bacterium]|jgi:hypothetical protein|nr:hypothetical protein [Pseudomonadota bacterium]